MATFTQHCGKQRAHGRHSTTKKRRNALGKVVGTDTYRCPGTRDLWQRRH